jgi:hypothetical protein
MPFYPDLHTESMVGHGDRHRAIGWLSSGHPFPRSAVPRAFVEVLKRHVGSAFQPLAFGGKHTCELCGNYSASGNVWVPTRDVVYVAPEMIVHYIVDHEYIPPEEFHRAVEACPPQGSPEYMRLISPYLSYFRITPPDPLPTPHQQSQIAKLLTRAFSDIARLCRSGDVNAAAALATACEDLPSKMHGWGLWYRHIFSRLVRNGRPSYPGIGAYLDEYNAIFGEDTDPELTAYTAAQASSKRNSQEGEPRDAPDPAT